VPSVGFATLQVIPVVKDITSSISQQMGPGLVTAGQRAGKQAGQAVADGLASAKAAVESASQTLAKARNAEADAAGKVRVAEQQLQSLRDRGVTDAGRLAAAEEKVEAARRKSATATGNAQSASDKLATAESKAADAARRLGDAAQSATPHVRGVGDAASSAEGGMSRMSAIAATGAGLVALAGFAVGAGTALLNVGEQFANVSKTLQFTTGATGVELEGLRTSVNNVAKASPKGLDEISSVMSQLSVRTKLSDKPLETLTKQVLKLNGMGPQFATDINGASAAMAAFGVKGADMSPVLDQLFLVSQKTGVGMDRLTAAAVKGAPQFKVFGFNLADTASLMGSLDQAGVSSDVILTGLNKAMISFSKSGRDSKEALAETITSIQDLTAAGNSEEAINMAGKIFGTKGAGQFVAAVQSGAISVDTLTASMDTAKGGILDQAGAIPTMSSAWAMFKNNVMIALEPVATRVFKIMTDGIAWFRTNGVQIIQSLSTAFSGWLEGPILPAIETFGRVVMELGATALPILWDGVQRGADLLGALGTAVNNTAQFFVDHQTAVAAVASIITIGLLPSLVSLTVGFASSAAAAVASAATSTAAWVALRIEAVTSAAAQVAAQYRIVGGWIASAASAVAGAATAVASYVAMGASAVLQAGISSAAWVASSLRTVGALAAQGAAFVVQKGIMAAGAIATGVMTAAQWALNVALTANPIGLVIAAIAAFVAGLVYAYNNSETFRNIVQQVWEVVKGAILGAWDVIKIAWDALVAGIGWMVQKFEDFKTGVGIVWTAVQDGIGAAVTWITDKWNTMVGFVTELPGRIRAGAAGMWDGIKDSFKSMINWVIEKWNSFADFMKMPDIPGVPNRGESFLPKIPLLRDGGLVTGPGTGTSDSIVAKLSNREYVMPAAETANNLPLLEALRAGWVPSAGFLHAMLPGFAEGGLVGAQEFAKSKSGGPYVYGAVGPTGYDCSGFMSDIYATMTGKQTGVRHFTTESDFEALGFVKGLGNGNEFSIGVMRGGGGPNSHMVGTLGNLNVEAGANGVIAGDGAQGAADLPLQWHLPQMGDPAGAGLVTGSPGSSGLGGGLGGGTSSGGGGGSSSSPGGTSGSQATDGTRVFVTNMPGSGMVTNPNGQTPAAPGTPGYNGTPAAGAPAGAAPTGGAPGQQAQQIPGVPGIFQGGGVFDPNFGQQSAEWAQNAGKEVADWGANNWREMLNTVVGVGLGNIGQRGGDTYQISGDPRTVATAIARNQQRKTRALQLGGGYGRP
jgi:TP901 family phage tail tape measure protein